MFMYNVLTNLTDIKSDMIYHDIDSIYAYIKQYNNNLLINHNYYC